MTLGGLALAVGILVDEGTVTLENIFYHLEQGKEIEPAILDGAQQIVIPAFVTLLCLHCVRADVPARRRRRLPVPAARRGRGVRACRLVPAVAHAGPDHGPLSHAWPMPARRRPCGTAAAPRNPLKSFQDGSTIAYAARARRAIARCCRSHSAFPRLSSPVSSPVVVSFGLWPFLGQNFFPAVDSGQIRCTSAPSPAPASRRPRGCSISSSRRSARPSRPISSTTSSTISACRFPASTWPTRTPARSDRPTATP